ncbi:fructose-6-phosphate aldolase [Temperatibacter marinus]|uniref:Probable transaldolase n=1 Tax=Temperatibacter marinus TaxID=1456591 RepID=A0AA52HBP4_9PROT|nr:fructose-6-phosphate aldolase [Temperatibacter marinus]WND03965.1 fructose-6-phosphate aldolase [Temperatibacter marinus]
MKFFLDTADINDIREANATGLLDGVTTNPSLIKQAGRDFFEVIAEIAAEVDGPVSAETTAHDHETMMKEGLKCAEIASNIAVKVPLTVDGLKTCKALRERDIMVNVTLCFSANQALLAAKAGATFISPFVGRHDDVGFNGMELIEDIRLVYDNYGFDTQILVASVRHPAHVLESARIGADVATMPWGAMRKLFNHPLTDSGLKGFDKDWAATGFSIL